MGEARSQGFSLRGALSLRLLDDRFPALHGARVLAILTVLQHHVGGGMLMFHQVPENLGFAFSRQIWFGMDLFFFLSGFLIGTILFHSKAEGTARGIFRFYARRSFRIVPLYMIVLTGLCFMPFTTGAQRSAVGWEFLYLTNYRPPDPPEIAIGSWSLCVEEHFYIIIPLLLAGLRRFRSGWDQLALLVALWWSGGLVRFTDYLVHLGTWKGTDFWWNLYRRTHDRYDILIAGIVMAFIVRRAGPLFDEVLARPAVRYVLGAIAACCALLLILPLSPYLGGDLFSVFRWGTVTSVLYMALVPLLISGDGWLKRLLSARVFRYVATLGYGVYLIHIPICLHVVLPLTMPLHHRHGLSVFATWWLSLGVLFVASLAGAYVLHLLVEKPALALRDRLVPTRILDASLPDPDPP
jgi:peptidoglycan/LPS O-acetylase OafA/YrhL